MAGRLAICASICTLVAACGGEEGSVCVPGTGCEQVVLCAPPEEPALAGPWPVGARTVDLNGLRAEVWYPAAPGSARGRAPRVYDIRRQLPTTERRKIPDDHTPWQRCACWANLPLDEKRGPYPVVIFIHGTAGFRTQSLEQTVHWASRGFVVLAADHPGLYLADMLALEFDSDLEGDVHTMLDVLGSAEGDLAFLDGHVDTERLALVGHSAGGQAVGTLADTPEVRVVITMAAGGVDNGPALQSVLVLGALDDQVVPYDRQQTGYEASPAPKRLVGIANAGHLAFSSLCALTDERGMDLIEIATEHEVSNVEFASSLWDGCAPDQLDPAQGWEIINHASSAVLEEVLHCTNDLSPFSGIESRFTGVAEYRQEIP